MFKKEITRPLVFIMLTAALTALSACNVINPTPTATPTPTEIPATPTPTQPPLAAEVNGEGIWLQDYQAELQRFKKAASDTGKQYDDQQASKMVLDDLVANTLLAQTAVKDGYKADETALQNRIDELTQQAGGSDAWVTWLKDNFYSESSLRQALSRSLAAAWERNHLIEAVPQTTEMVHARQILVRTDTTATAAIEELQAGGDFETLAKKYDDLTAGDLGWFARGSLYIPEVEKAAFELQPGQYSSIIQSAYGYHIVQVLEHDPQHPLTTDARLALQHKLLEAWMADALKNAQINILVK
ncbi:MAG: peptidylprolyl isomerase [Anaerolineae bacterium]|nr:peptidylprolyl isomerase [Anaerolineae bacterium]